MLWKKLRASSVWNRNYNVYTYLGIYGWRDLLEKIYDTFQDRVHVGPEAMLLRARLLPFVFNKVLYDLVHLEYGILSSFSCPLCPIYLFPQDPLLLSSLHVLCLQTDRYIDKSLTL